MISRDNLIEMLRNHEILVTFTKKNGDIREMFCTLAEDIIPEVSGDSNRINDDLITVYDIDKLEWRSFNYSSITNISIDN